LHNAQWTRRQSALFIVHSAFCLVPSHSALLVSVIIPTFNRAALLCETLATVSAQTVAPFEILVIDDGSTDETGAMLAREFPGVMVYRIAHAGQGAARNVGLAHARGDAIAFLDSDDVWDARFVECMSAALCASPRAGFVYCDYALFDGARTLRENNLRPEHQWGGNVFPKLLETNFLCTGALLIRRECFARVGGFDPTLPPVEDWDLWLRLARAYPAVFVDASLVRIRVNGFHASRNPPIIYARNLQLLDKLRREFPDDARCFRALLQRQTQNFHWALATYFRVQGQRLRALKHYAHFVGAHFFL
jgi:GT2 family glycosyltransferase